MHTLSLADELADTRAEIERLKQREAALRAAILAWDGPLPNGRWARVEILERRARIFDKGLLPRNIREDPQFWRERASTYVKCLPVQLAGARPGGSRHPTRKAASFSR